MHFEVRHEFAVSREKFVAAMFHDDYPKFLLAKHPVLLELEPQEKQETDREVRRKVRYRPKPVIKSIGPKTVPPEWFAFIEESTYDKAAFRMTFQNVPTTGKISRMLVNKGTITLRDLGGTRTERVVAGDIQLVLPFLLKPLGLIGEKVIQSEGVKILDGEAAVMREFLREHG